jgi:hypothetical protein
MPAIVVLFAAMGRSYKFCGLFAALVRLHDWQDPLLQAGDHRVG